MKNTLILFILTCSYTLYGQVFTHRLGTYADPRDGQTYQTITFEKKIDSTTTRVRTWFAENARYKSEGSYCYNDTDAYCKKYGRLYHYEAAIEACPAGWHVPTLEEWNYLFSFFGGRHKAGAHLIEGQESDMNLLYGGFAEPGHLFKDITISGNWWDSESKSISTAGIITLIKGSSEIYHTVIGNSHKLSTRCVKKHE